MRHIFKYTIIGALFGLSTCSIIVATSHFNEFITGQELLRHLIISFVLGIGCGLISLIFNIERLSFIVKLAMHYVGILVLVLLSGTIGQWYESPLETPLAFLLFIFIQLFVYIVIFFIVYWLNVKEIKEINKRLSQR